MPEETTEQRIKEEYELTISMMEKQYRELVSKYEKAEAESQSSRASLLEAQQTVATLGNALEEYSKRPTQAELANTREELARIWKIVKLYYATHQGGSDPGRNDCPCGTCEMVRDALARARKETKAE